MKSNSKPVVLYTFYRPPNSTPDVLQSLNNSLQRNSESSRVVVIGDFNLPSVKWSSDLHTTINIGSSPENEAFCEMVEDNFLQQFILSSLAIYSTCCYVTLPTALVTFPYPILSLAVFQQIITSWNLKFILDSIEPRQLNARFSITKTETSMVCVIILHNFL